MSELQVQTHLKAVTVLKNGGNVVAKTDTIYGLLARADDEMAVRRLYGLKDRQDKKPCIILISSLDMLYDEPDTYASDFLRRHWPGPVSVVMPAPSAPDWLLRGGDTLAYRLPDDPQLRELIDQTGPLIAPSANPEGLAPARDIIEAREYFGDAIDMYVDGGIVPDNTAPSQLWRISPGADPEQLR